MKATTFLRLLLYLVGILGAHLASAQIADREPAAPRVAAALPAEPATDDAAAELRRRQILRTVADALQLQPHQLLALRRTLAAAPGPGLPLGLTEVQVARLHALETREPAVRRLSLLAPGP